MNKKILFIGIAIIAVIIIAITSTFFFLNRNNEKKAKEAITNFITLINEKKYDEMYEKTASMNMSKEDFVTRNKNIYNGIDACNISIEISNIEKQNNEYHVYYHEKMYTSAGELNFDNDANLIKENGEYKLKWTSKIIYPQLEDNYKMRISTIKSKRGDILDRNNNKLATDGTILSVGIVPGKLNSNKNENIEEISKLLGISTDYINKQLSASWVKDDTFVPIKKIVANNTELKEKLLEIKGILINKEIGRVYSLGEEAGHLIGYVQEINEEELKEKSQDGYTSTSVIGKSGLEKSFEDKLRGIDGAEIYIVDEKNNKVVDVAKKDKKDGENIKLTIDSNLQKKIYNQMKEDNGLFVTMNPETGELLALVSTPTFDSNDFAVGMTTDKWNELNSNKNKPLYNRFIQKYCPGSTFKPITGAIALTTGKIKKDENLNYSGTSWQKDNSWGNYHITTLTAYNGPKNLLNGLIHSDNIYFAQTALKIGNETFINNLNKIGFNESIEFPISLAKSQYSSNNGTSIDSETMLADSGYGQGNILVNPIHISSIYSSFYNNGNMIKPYIEYKENAEPEILKENAFSKDAANTIKNALIQVVENNEGTAKDMRIPGLTIAGKTGTAELKSSKEDNESGTLGWFNCFTIGRKEGDLLIVSMVENEQDNQDGGSHYLIKKIKAILN